MKIPNGQFLQMLDMVKPMRGNITLGDLKRCKMTPIFFDTFFNLEKYLEHEQRDPFATQRDLDEVRGFIGGLVSISHKNLIPSRCPIGIDTPHRNTNCWWPRRAEKHKGEYSLHTKLLYVPISVQSPC